MKSIAVFVLGMSILVAGIPNIFAQEYLQDVYVESTSPTKIPWELTSINSEYTESFYCDKTPQSTFMFGKTTVRCIEIKSDGDIRSSFVVTIGYTVVQVPEWFKTPTMFWLAGTISDAEYFAAIETMMQNGYISIPHTESQKEPETIPVWVYDNSKRWVNGTITDDEFSIGLQWLIKNGFISSI